MLRIRNTIILITLIGSLQFCKHNNIQSQQIQQQNEPVTVIDTIPFSFKMITDMRENWYLFGRIILPVQIKDTTVYALLDNGFPYTFIIKPLFNKLCHSSRIPHNVYTADTSALMPVDFDLRIHDFVLHEDTIGIHSDDILTKRHSKDIDISIVIGLDLFEKNIVEIDFQNNRLLVYDKLPDRVTDFEVWNVYYDAQYNRLRRVTIPDFVSKDRQVLSGDFLIDLGSCGTELFSFSSFAKRVDLEAIRQDSLTWGHKILHWSSFPMQKSSTHKKSLLNLDGIIGMDFLWRFNVIFDFQNNKLYLKPRTL
ncbi:MAG: hypothetical protein LBK03_04835 [Bacteroidales bacterium]|jgi:hypothetical protein|nr:hypothetical protein [Bacteroidales bacterium]